jgi:hypothetical protein
MKQLIKGRGGDKTRSWKHISGTYLRDDDYDYWNVDEHSGNGGGCTVNLKTLLRFNKTNFLSLFVPGSSWRG